MTPIERKWWCLLDELPTRLGTVHCWSGGRILAPFSQDGSFHANPTSVVCLAGVIRIRSAKDTIDLHPGEALLIGAGIWHVHEPLRPGSVGFGQGFLPAWSDVLLQDPHHEWRGRLPSEPSRRIMDAALLTPSLAKRRALFAELVTQVLAETVNDLSFSAPVRRMVDHLWSQIHLGVKVDDLVRVSGLSRAQAYRMFTAGYGLPPKEAIARTRMWLAEGLIAGGISASEAARQSGYPTVETFRRAWKAADGAAVQ